MEKPRMHFEFHLKGTYVLTAGKRSLSRSDQAGRCMHPTRRTYTEICREMHQRTVQHAPFNFAIFFFSGLRLSSDSCMRACVRQYVTQKGVNSAEQLIRSLARGRGLHVD